MTNNLLSSLLSGTSTIGNDILNGIGTIQHLIGTDKPIANPDGTLNYSRLTGRSSLSLIAPAESISTTAVQDFSSSGLAGTFKGTLTGLEADINKILAQNTLPSKLLGGGLAALGGLAAYEGLKVVDPNIYNQLVNTVPSTPATAIRKTILQSPGLQISKVHKNTKRHKKVKIKRHSKKKGR